VVRHVCHTVLAVKLFPLGFELPLKVFLGEIIPKMEKNPPPRQSSTTART
jgi:hypothetical protein